MVRAMRVERERACDDQVLAAGTKASDYAHELLDIVSGLREPELAIALAMPDAPSSKAVYWRY